MLKIGFPTPTPKNRFQILNLHPKKHIKKTWSSRRKLPFLHSFSSENVLYIKKISVRKLSVDDVMPVL